MYLEESLSRMGEPYPGHSIKPRASGKTTTIEKPIWNPTCGLPEHGRDSRDTKSEHVVHPADAAHNPENAVVLWRCRWITVREREQRIYWNETTQRVCFLLKKKKAAVVSPSPQWCRPVVALCSVETLSAGTRNLARVDDQIYSRCHYCKELIKERLLPPQSHYCSTSVFKSYIYYLLFIYLFTCW